jgi:putative peptide zinc metalloprotease protein
VLSPCLYCDVSDSWLLPNKWQRVWIGAAGIYVELTMASIATFIWWNSEPGLLNNLALSTMFVCSVNTVMFNANPLLRYDGYYMLMDMMEIPNLRAKAARFFSSIFGKVCLGLPTDIETYLPRSRRVFFLLFAIASYVYRWFISFTILWFMYRFLRPYKLGTVSLLLAIGSLGTLLVVPSYQLGKFLWESRRMSTVSRLRLGLTLLVLAIAAGLVFFLPLPLTVSTSFVMMPQQPQFVWVEVPGQLREQLVKDGDTVETGDVLARLENYAKRDELVSLQRQVEQHRLEIDLHRFTGKDPSGSERKLAAELAEKMQELVETVQKDLNRLELRAERPGIVIQPPRPEQLGTSMPTGALFCLIGDAAKLEARLVIDQADIDLVDPGQTADLKLYSLPLQTIEGKLTEIGPAVETVPAELSNTAGGEVPTKTDPRTGQERPTHTHFEALVPVANPDNIMQPGMRGKAKIEARKLPLAGRIWRWVTRTFHFESG